MIPRPDRPWLSVVMPVHRGAHFLDATLSSMVDALGHDAAGVELLCLDSGRDDGASRAVADRYADRLAIDWTDAPEVPLWTAKTNLGMAAARADAATMLHQDDLWLPGHGAALRQASADLQHAVMSIGPSRLVGPSGEPAGDWHLPFAAGTYAGANAAQTLIVQNSIAIPAPVFRRDTWAQVGGLDDALWYTADWDLWLKLARAGDVIVRAEATTAFRLHGGSLTMTGSRDLADFAQQHHIVLDRHSSAMSPRRLRQARAAIAVNVALAGASRGQWHALPPALGALLRLGPTGLPGFLNATRLVDRVGGRLRLKLAGKM